MVDFKDKGEQSVFTFKNTHNTIVNSIRRIIINEVPTFAIEDVEVVKNDSPLYDETVAQRLGLIPIKTDLTSYELRDQCKCGSIGCAMCEVKMSLKQSEDGYVYSSAIKSDDPQIIPTDLDIPITKLFKGKEIELNLKAILGTGKEHMKWSPAHVYLNDDGKNVDLIVEPYGQLDAKVMYNKSIDILIEKIEDLEKGLN